MRLINVKTLELEEFFDIRVPTYAILSHTWGEGEVSFQDWADRDNCHSKPGYEKIIRACAVAAENNVEYLWVDTNCIDKTSSAELSEAVNSMYKWYRRSHVCIAYLEDVPYSDLKACMEPGSAFWKGRWFTRGWTLQELIAPTVMKFYSNDWRELGTRAMLAITISEITGVGWFCMLRGKHENPLLRYSIAQRLSWASRRETTRLEDQAYSLLGLFDISMPLVYGEGHAAFTRLLQELIRKYADHSILASQLRYIEFLPRSPKDFVHSSNVIHYGSMRIRHLHLHQHHQYPFHMTNTGLQLSLPLVPTLSPDVVFGVLDCWDVDSAVSRLYRTTSRVWIPLRRKGSARNPQFTRLMWPCVFLLVGLLRRSSITTTSLQMSDVAAPVAVADELADSHGKPDIQIVPAPAPGDRSIDFAPKEVHDILIKKPFATAISPPKWHRRHAGCPFMICFPRSTPQYRLYAIFPHLDSQGEVLNPQGPLSLSLVFPAMTLVECGVNDGNSEGSDGTEKDATGEEESDTSSTVGRALLVFKKRGTRPAKFLAISLANIPDPEDESQHQPSCKIIHDWTPEIYGSGVPVLDAETYTATDQDNDVLVTVQKVICKGERVHGAQAPRFIGLTQVIFDKEKLCQEIGESEKQDTGMLAGMFRYMGQVDSEDED